VKYMRRISNTAITCAALACAAVIAAAPNVRADSIDFSSLADGTAVTTEYPGVTFSLEGGPDSSGPPTINSYEGEGGALANSTNPDYPTANILNIAFAAPVSGVSFTFDNEGDNGTTLYLASNGSTANISGDSSGFTLVTVAGGGITNLQINNGYPSDASWYFDIQELNYTLSGTTSAPEPGTLGLTLIGLGSLGLMMVMRKRMNQGLSQAS